MVFRIGRILLRLSGVKLHRASYLQTFYLQTFFARPLLYSFVIWFISFA